MATYYVYSGAVGSGDGSSWANAFTVLKTAMAAPRLAGDIFYVSHQHNEVAGSSYWIQSPGTAVAPQKVYCVNDGAEPPVALATTGAISTTTTTELAFYTGYAYFYGMVFTAGSGSSNATLKFNNGSSAFGFRFKDCKFLIGGTGSTGKMDVGTSSNTGDQYIEWVNCTVQFAAVGQKINITGAPGQFTWRDTLNAVAGATIPTVLMNIGSVNDCPNALISGVDFSALVAGKTLLNNSSTGRGRVQIQNCKLNAAATLYNRGTPSSHASAQVDIDTTDSAAATTRFERYRFQGVVTQETTNVKLLGATDRTTPIAWKMVSNAQPTYQIPLTSPPFVMRHNATGGVNVSVEILHDSLTALKDNEVWLEVEHLASGLSPITTRTMDRSLNEIFATPADQTASSASWVTSGLTNPNAQQLSVDITPAMKGLFKAVVCLAKPTYTIYVDPIMKVI